MPTGYTESVQDGTVTDFADFALQCARAFGACISMRDDPMDAPVPDEFTASDYNGRALVEAQADLAKLAAMSPTDRQAAADLANAEAAKTWDDHEEEKARQNLRYEAMLEKVHQWAPPTDEHTGLKKFMIEQLTHSIDFDCGPPYSKRPTPKTVDDWYSEALADAHRTVAYHAKTQAEEIERARKRTQWIRDLRASLLPSKSEAARRRWRYSIEPIPI